MKYYAANFANKLNEGKKKINLPDNENYTTYSDADKLKFLAWNENRN